MVDPVSNGKTLFGERYDESIDSLSLRLGLKCADLQMALGANHPKYKRFLAKEYEPAMKRISDYLNWKTDKHPGER